MPVSCETGIFCLSKVTSHTIFTQFNNESFTITTYTGNVFINTGNDTYLLVEAGFSFIAFHFFRLNSFMISAPFSLPTIYNQVQPLGNWFYMLLALFVAVEGPLATLAAAIASSTGYLDPRLVFVSASCGNLSADILWYSLGYLGKIELLGRYGGWLGIKQDTILRLKQGIHDHVGKFLFVAKLTLGLVVPTLIAAGLARVSWRRWIGVLFLAESIWTGSLVLAGYYYGQYLLNMEKGLKLISIGSTAILIIILGIYALRWRSQKDNR
jgi:membrane protein DedA with SNARE-associated domain